MWTNRRSKLQKPASNRDQTAVLPRRFLNSTVAWIQFPQKLGGFFVPFIFFFSREASLWDKCIIRRELKLQNKAVIFEAYLSLELKTDFKANLLANEQRNTFPSCVPYSVHLNLAACGLAWNNSHEATTYFFFFYIWLLSCVRHGGNVTHVWFGKGFRSDFLPYVTLTLFILSLGLVLGVHWM